MSEFSAAVALYCQGLDTVSVGCLGEECKHADGNPEHTCEPFFSWAQCDSCGSTLGGDRDVAFGLWTDEGEHCRIEMTICTDCIMFHANGEEPDEW